MKSKKPWSALKVDVHNPDYKLIVEIREKNTYLMAETHLGAQGFPVGVGAKAMLMLSEGLIRRWLAI